MTTVEQSKRLIDAGLDPARYTATWCLCMNPENRSFISPVPVNEAGVDAIPCWDVQDLLDIMPEAIDVKTNPKRLFMQKWYDDEDERFNYSLFYQDNEGLCYHEVYRDTLEAAAVEMVVWLLDNGYITKRYYKMHDIEAMKKLVDEL